MMCGPVGLAHLTAGYKFLNPNPVSFDNASWIPVSTPVLEEKTYPGNVTRQRRNVHHMFFPDLLQIIDEKIPKVYKHKYGWFDIRSSKISVLHKIYDLMYPPNLNHLYLTRKKEKFQDVIEIL